MTAGVVWQQAGLHYKCAPALSPRTHLADARDVVVAVGPLDLHPGARLLPRLAGGAVGRRLAALQVPCGGGQEPEVVVGGDLMEVKLVWVWVVVAAVVNQWWQERQGAQLGGGVRGGGQCEKRVAALRGCVPAMAAHNAGGACCAHGL